MFAADAFSSPVFSHPGIFRTNDLKGRLTLPLVAALTPLLLHQDRLEAAGSQMRPWLGGLSVRAHGDQPVSLASTDARNDCNACQRHE